MREVKVHLKEIAAKLRGHERVLIMGPLDPGKSLIKKTIARLRPTLIFYIDGGLIHKKKQSLKRPGSGIVEISLGDGDSAGKGMTPDYLVPVRKDYSDLAFAFLCLQKSKTSLEKIVLLGFSGKSDERLDHFLANLGVVEQFVRLRKTPVSIDGHFDLVPAGKNVLKYKGTFSVLSLRPNKIKISGKVDYALRAWTSVQPLSSLGLSNCANGKFLIESKAPLVIYFTVVNIN